MMNKLNLKLHLLTLITLYISVLQVTAQDQSSLVYAIDEARNPILTAVPFIAIAPDSRATGMGDVGAATSPDVNSAYWNSGKLAFVDQAYGASLSYSPWLKNIVPDMGITYISGFYKIDKVQTVGASFRYFNLGVINLTDELGNSLGIDKPSELYFDGTYSRKLSDRWGIGVSARYINSNLVGASGGQDKAATSVAVDLGTYFVKPVTLGITNAEYSFGANISNIGQKVSYGVRGSSDFIPTNLRVGNALKLQLDPYNSLTLAMDFNKLLVPTPPVYAQNEDGSFQEDNNGNRIIAKGKDPDRNLIAGMFGSFSDAPGGFSEELKEVTISTGAEYWYRQIFAARLGYVHEHDDKGGRRYASLGFGVRYMTFGFDFSYLIPGDKNNPLADVLRFSLIWQLEETDDTDR